MPVQTVYRIAFLWCICCLISCSRSRSAPRIKKVPLVHVQGQATVDGKPEAGVVIKCVPQGSFEAKGFEKSLGGLTDDHGRFALGTYEAGDGLPPGDYALTASWPPALSLARENNEQRLAANDRFHGKYDTVEKSPLKFTVEKGKPLKLDEVALKTK